MRQLIVLSILKDQLCRGDPAFFNSQKMCLASIRDCNPILDLNIPRNAFDSIQLIAKRLSLESTRDILRVLVHLGGAT